MRSWLKTLVNPSATFKKTIEILHSSGLRIALVVDEDNHLLGTVTDGDIRRALLNHKAMDVYVTEVMNREPMSASIKDEKGSILSHMRTHDLLHMPIIDDHGRLFDLKTLHNLIDNERHDNPVLLMAGGFGKRLSPLTNDVPKPLLRVGSKPILATILEQFIKNGFHDFFISTHYKAEMIRDYFGDGERWGVTIKYIHEDIPLGTAGAFGLLPDGIANLPIIMMNGDLLTKVDFGQLLEFHNNRKNLATICVSKYDIKVPYGVVDHEGDLIKDIVEKPTHNFFINAGIYVLDPSIRKNVDKESYLDMPNLLKQQIKNGDNINMYPIHEYWLDIGRMDEYEEAHEVYESEFNS